MQCDYRGLLWCSSHLPFTQHHKQARPAASTMPILRWGEWPERRNLPGVTQLVRDGATTPACLGALLARWSPSPCSHPSIHSTLPGKASCSRLKLPPLPGGPVPVKTKMASCPRELQGVKVYAYFLLPVTHPRSVLTCSLECQDWEGPQ